LSAPIRMYHVLVEVYGPDSDGYYEARLSPASPPSFKTDGVFVPFPAELSTAKSRNYAQAGAHLYMQIAEWMMREAKRKDESRQS
jgi:hypothetical protein